MPELPEVETVIRMIRPSLEGRTIVGSRVLWRPMVGEARFGDRVRGARIEAVRRRAKYILIELDRGVLVGHLKMSGRMHVEAAGSPMLPYARLRLDLDDGHNLQFVDVRKFGRLRFAREAAELLPDLGPEPLGDEFTAAWFRKALRRRRRMLKPLLLDQAFVAGIGNIYADESLHRARLHPERRADTVPARAATRLHAAIREILFAAVELEGSTFDRFYRTPEGNPGSYQYKFRAYGKQGKPCPECGRPIRRIVVGSRGTHFCPRCQPKPRT
jgi:formamidopyrimidine-DNA glycosylase